MTKAVSEQKREINHRRPPLRPRSRSDATHEVVATDGNRVTDATEHMTRVEDMQSASDSETAATDRRVRQVNRFSRIRLVRFGQPAECSRSSC